MTDFGGSGQGGTVAECELNIPVNIQSGTSLTCNDLNLLGCTTSTTTKLGQNPERIESNDSGFSSNSYRSDLKSEESDQGTHDSDNVGKAPSTKNTRREMDTNRPRSQQRTRKKHFMRNIISAVTSGFANCSKKRKQPPHTKPNDRRHSDSEEDSGSADSFGNNFKSNCKRHISRDGGFPVGSEATSTGYVSDSVDGYDKCKGLESEHGTTSGSGCGRSQKDGFDSSIGEPIKNELKPVAADILLETSVTNAVSTKLNMNIKYDDDEEIEEPEVEAEVEKQSELKPEMTSQKRQKTKSETEYVYVAEDDTEEEDEEESSEATEDVSQTGGYTHETPMHTSKNSDSNMSDSDISDYETNDSSSSYVEMDVASPNGSRGKASLDVIHEEYDDALSPDDYGAEFPEKKPSRASSSIKRKKSSVKKGVAGGKGSLRRKSSTVEQDLKNGMKIQLASLRNDLKAKEEDAISRTSSLKDMIHQFETAVAALEIQETKLHMSSDSEEDEAPLGVKAIAQKIQEQTAANVDEGLEIAQMPPSQILKLKQALDLEDEKLSKPIPLSRRSESKVKLIAKQLAEAEKRRIQMEKLAKSQMCKSPKDIKKTASTSFINELLEMARAEDVSSKQEKSKKVEEPHDFKQSLLAARKKITHREENKENSKTGNKPEVPLPTITEPEVGKSSATKLEKSNSVSSMSSTGMAGSNEEVDPFVKDVLCSKTVPEPVKQKIRIECWSLFNDPRTPKGVKQCILATMLSKVQNE